MILDLGQSYWRKCYALPPERPMWQWCEDHIVLGARQPTAYKGPYSTDLNAYVRGVFDALQDTNVHTVTIKKGAQTGLSLVLHCALGYWICEDPDPMLLVMPNSAIGQSVSETRIQPIIEDSPRIAREMTGDPDDFKKMQYQLKQCVLNIVGSNSAANLATRPVRFLLLDEVDKFPEQTGKEARAVHLAIERTKTFEMFRKIIENSTPTTPSGHITVSYDRSDKRRYFVPCPKCGVMQVLEWERIKFDSKADPAIAARDAYYQCENDKCGHHWTDGEKEEAVERGEWRSTATSHDPGHVGFHLPSFYAPWVKWSDVVTNFLESKDVAADLQNFVNSTLGEEWTPPPVESIGAELILRRQAARDYRQATVPTEDPVMLGAMVDVQKQYLVYSVWALGYSDQYLIDHGQLPGPEAITDDLLKRTYFDAAGKEYSVPYALCDAAYRTTEIYTACLADRRIVPIVGLHGVDFKPSEFIIPREVKSFPGGKMFGGRQKLTLVHIHPSEFKDQFARALNDKGTVSVWFHNGIIRDENYIKQLCGEVKQETKPDRFGQVGTFWEKVGPNDYFDTAQYSFAYRHMMTNQLAALRPKGAAKAEPVKESEPEPPEPDPQASTEPAVACRNCGHKPMTPKPRQKGHECPKCRRFQSARASRSGGDW